MKKTAVLASLDVIDQRHIIDLCERYTYERVAEIIAQLEGELFSYFKHYIAPEDVNRHLRVILNCRRSYVAFRKLQAQDNAPLKPELIKEQEEPTQTTSPEKEDTAKPVELPAPSSEAGSNLEPKRNSDSPEQPPTALAVPSIKQILARELANTLRSDKMTKEEWAPIAASLTAPAPKPTIPDGPILPKKITKKA